MRSELKNINLYPNIYNTLKKNNWIINRNSKKNYNFYFIGEISHYFLNIFYNKNNLYFEFTIDLEIPKNKLCDLLSLINYVNQNTDDGYFVFDLKLSKVKFIIMKFHVHFIDQHILSNNIDKNLTFTNKLFHNFVFGIHHLIYAEKFQKDHLKLLFLNAKGHA